MTKPLTYFSMFSGIGGFELGIERANNRIKLQEANPSLPQDSSDNGSPMGHGRGARTTCIGYSEIDPHAIKTYEEHFNHVNYGDATKINARELPSFDLLVGGFPCQAFSIAGKRGGFEDTRGTLFFDVARILAEKRPRYLVLENVKGLLSHDNGKTFTTILGVLADLGYFVEWQVLNSKDFGVPQNRERVFIVGHLGVEPRSKVFPIVNANRTTTKGHESQDTKVEIAQTIRSRYSNGSGSHVQLTETRTEEAKRIRRESQKNGKDWSPRRGKVLKPRPDSIANTITGSQSKESFVLGDSKIRRLTPIECERLQGFPDNWTIGSDTQRYKQCGNAITVNVAAAVVAKLLEVSNALS